MPFAEVTSASGSIKSAGTTVSTSTNVVVPAGTLIVLLSATDNTTQFDPNVSSISRPSGETASWVMVDGDAGAANGPTANASTHPTFAFIKTTVAWNEAVTVTYAASVTAKGIALRAFSGGDKFAPVAGYRGNGPGNYDGEVGSASNAASFTYGSGTANIPAGTLVVAGVATEDNSMGTAPVVESGGGTWSGAVSGGTTGGNALTNQFASLWWKETTTDATTMTPSVSNGTDTAGSLFLFKPAFAGVRMWNGSQWVTAKFWNGTAWVTGRVYNGTAWV